LEVYTTSQNYWSRIIAARKSLLSVRRVVLSNKTIWPSQCDCIVASLHEAILPIQAFYKFLEKQERGICSSRYPVIYALIDSEALLEELITLVSTLRECCLHASPKTAVLITDILQEFD